MKIPPLLSAILILAASAVSLLATPETDQKATDAAMKSYVIRVLQNHVTVKVVDGVATLSGTTETLDGKDMAEDAVSNLPGVTRVDDKIVIEPAISEHSDAWIGAKIRLILLVRANISLNNITVDVRDGTVTLNGTVRSLADKTMVENCAKDVDGVKAINDLIGVGAPSNEAKVVVETIDDASITAQVRYALLTDPGTKALKPKIMTNNGVVVITGEAASEAEKALVSQLAGSVRGVVSVTNNLTLKS